MIELLNIDCMEYMATLPDKAFDLAVVDPPYGIGMDNSNKRTKPSRPNSYTEYPNFRYHIANWDSEPPSITYFLELSRVSQNQIIWGANYFCSYLPNGKGWIFWNKLNGSDNCFSDGEFAFSSFGVQSRCYAVSQFHNLRGGKDRIHPTQKPVALYDWLLRNYAKQGQRILDTHLGSGSSAIAAHYFGCDFVGCEIDTDYFNAAKARFDRETRQVALF